MSHIVNFEKQQYSLEKVADDQKDLNSLEWELSEEEMKKVEKQKKRR